MQSGLLRIRMMTLDNSDKNSVFQRNIQRGIRNKILSLTNDDSKITYYCSRQYSANFKNPAESMRASFFVELISDYQYSAQRIDVEVNVERRIPDDRADIVVYEDDARQSPFIVVECKKDSISNAEYNQAIEQCFGNANSKRAKYAIVVAGNTRTAFNVAGFKAGERQKNVIADIPIKYGKAPKYKFVKGHETKDLNVVSREELIRALEKCHDTVWQGGKLAPTAAFDEVSKLLFCKLKDEKETVNKETYKFQIGTYETAAEVFKRIDGIYQESKKGNGEVFNENIKLDSKIVYTVVEHLQEIAINKIDLDTKGLAFERFMQDFFKGKMGQFFTPRPIVEFAVKMLAPKFSDRILDPACGSGGFLLHSMDLIRKFAEQNYDPIEGYGLWHNFAMNNLYGIEINDQIARVCKMNMILHDDGHTNIISADSLDDITHIHHLYPKFKESSFDMILTNPPFGAVVKSTEKEEGYLEKFKLGEHRKNQKTEILFTEQCIKFLKPETGRLAIVLPDGLLTTSSFQYVRDYLMEHTQILAVISLPQFTFTHFEANVKSSILFVRRKGIREELSAYPIFMALADHIAYDASGRDDHRNDLDSIINEFRNFEKNPNSVSVSSLMREKVFIIHKSELSNRIDSIYYAKPIYEFLRKISYPIVTIGEISKLMKTGFAAGKKDQETRDIENGILQIRPTNISEKGNLIFEKNIYIQKKYLSVRSDSLLQKDEILFNNTNSQELVGKSAFFNSDGNYFCSNHITRIQVNSDLLLPKFLKHILNEYQKRGIFYAICTNWNNQSGVNTELLKTVQIPLPPIEIQRRIADDIENHLKHAENLRQQAITEEKKADMVLGSVFL